MSPEIQKETKAQRAQRERTERRQKNAAIEASNRLKRRILIFGGITASITTAVGLGVIVLNPDRSKPLVTPSRTITPVESTEDRLMLQEVQRLGVSYSPTETAMWQNEGFLPYAKNIPPIENVPESLSRIDRALNLMSRSQNPYFKRAHGSLRAFQSQGSVETVIRKDRDISEDLVSVISIIPGIQNRRIVWHLEASSEELLYRSTAISVATKLSHEDEHLRNLNIYLGSLPGLTPDQQLNLLIQKAGNVQDFISEEARGYGVEAKSYIYQYGLTGYRQRGSLLEENSLAFIRARSNLDSPAWKEYLARNILADLIKQREQNSLK